MRDDELRCRIETAGKADGIILGLLAVPGQLTEDHGFGLTPGTRFEKAYRMTDAAALPTQLAALAALLGIEGFTELRPGATPPNFRILKG